MGLRTGREAFVRYQVQIDGKPVALWTYRASCRQEEAADPPERHERQFSGLGVRWERDGGDRLCAEGCRVSLGSEGEPRQNGGLWWRTTHGPTTQ